MTTAPDGCPAPQVFRPVSPDQGIRLIIREAPISAGV